MEPGSPGAHDNNNDRFAPEINGALIWGTNIRVSTCENLFEVTTTTTTTTTT
jgi:hypothetical protein